MVCAISLWFRGRDFWPSVRVGTHGVRVLGYSFGFWVQGYDLKMGLGLGVFVHVFGHM